jgi:hypothetical protein
MNRPRPPEEEEDEEDDPIISAPEAGPGNES